MVQLKFGRQLLIGLSLVGIGALYGCVSTTPTTSHAKKTAPTPESPASSLISTEAANATVAAATRQVIASEQAFAKTMADRNFKTFVTFLSQDAVFFSGSEVTRGPAAVAAKWESYFAGREAPFSWTPDHVEVLASGNLALSTGPVFQNHKIVGRFSSIWRLESGNTWRVVFDKGETVCAITP
jgi:ketosteroid isomerase-like protein